MAARGFQHGTAPNALVIGWNGGHTAVTLPDGTPVSSGEGGGVRIGGGGAYQAQFTHHMFLLADDVDLADGPAPVELVGAVAPDPAPELLASPPDPAPPAFDPAPVGDPGTADS